MKTQDGDAAARLQAGRQRRQEGVERGEFLIDGNAQRLERSLQGALDGGFALFDGQFVAQAALHRPAHTLGELTRGQDVLALQSGGQRHGVRLVGVVHEQVAQALPCDLLQQLAGRQAHAGVQPQVERAIGLEAETARGVVDLHRRHAQVGQHQIEATPGLGQQRGHLGEIQTPHRQHRGIETEAAQARFTARQLLRIDVDRPQAAARCQPRQQFLRVATETQRGVQPHLTGPRRQDGHDLGHADRAVGAGGSLAALHHLLQLIGVSAGVQLLVLLGVALGVGAGVAHAPTVGGRWR